MKLEAFTLACGSPATIEAFIRKYIAPHKLHAEDMAELVEKIMGSQESFACHTKCSVSLWDTAWPHRVWMFNQDYLAFNKAEDNPAAGLYVKPMICISAQRASVKQQPMMINYVLKNPIEL